MTRIEEIVLDFGDQNTLRFLKVVRVSSIEDNGNVRGSKEAAYMHTDYFVLNQ